MKILVTGATGTVGPNVVKRLSEAGHQVYAQVRPGSHSVRRIEPFGVEIRHADLSDRDAVERLVDGVDAVIHLAMQRLDHGADFDVTAMLTGLVDVNVRSTLLLLEGVRKRNPGIKRFVSASSVVLYPQWGFNTRPFVLADKRARPLEPYAISKLAGELIVEGYCRDHHVPAVNLMLPETFCGRELLGERMLYVSPFTADHIAMLERRPPSGERDAGLETLRKLQRDKKELVVPLTPEGAPWRRHVGDVRDVATACLLALDAPNAIGKTVPIQSDALDYGVAVRHLAGITGMKFAEAAVPFGDCYWYDLTETGQALGYRPAFDSKRMIEDAWRHLHGEDIGVVAGERYPRINR